MEFNYALEKKKFDERWTRFAAEYAAAGMAGESIEAMKEFDWESFKSDRIYSLHNQSLSSFNNDNVGCPYLQKFQESFSCPALETDPDRRYGWTDEIENENLSILMKQLSPSDIELLTLFAVDGYSVTEIAKMQSVKWPTISKKLTRIEKYLKKFEEVATD